MGCGESVLNGSHVHSSFGLVVRAWGRRGLAPEDSWDAVRVCFGWILCVLQFLDGACMDVEEAAPQDSWDAVRVCLGASVDAQAGGIHLGTGRPARRGGAPKEGMRPGSHRCPPTQLHLLPAACPTVALAAFPAHRRRRWRQQRLWSSSRQARCSRA